MYGCVFMCVQPIGIDFDVVRMMMVTRKMTMMRVVIEMMMGFVVFVAFLVLVFVGIVFVFFTITRVYIEPGSSEA